MSLEETRNLAEKAKEKIHRKRIIGKMVERVGAVALSEDGKATWTRAEPGEYYIARMGFFGVKDRIPCGTNSPYNDDKSKASAKMLETVKGYDPENIDKMAEHEKRKVREISASKSAGKEVG